MTMTTMICRQLKDTEENVGRIEVAAQRFGIFLENCLADIVHQVAIVYFHTTRRAIRALHPYFAG